MLKDDRVASIELRPECLEQGVSQILALAVGRDDDPVGS